MNVYLLYLSTFAVFLIKMACKSWKVLKFYANWFIKFFDGLVHLLM